MLVTLIKSAFEKLYHQTEVPWPAILNAWAMTLVKAAVGGGEYLHQSFNR